MNQWLENKIKQGFEPDPDAPLGTPDNPSSKIFTIANAITLLRMALTAIFLWMFVTDVNRYISVAVYAAAASTDWMDGKVARQTQTVSWFGKLLDPICDRFLLFCGVLGLVVRAELPVWVAVLIIGRDIYLAWGQILVRMYRERPIDVVFSGKIATALLMFGFCDMLLGLPVLQGFKWTTIPWLPLLNNDPACLGILFVYLGCIFSVITAIVYTYEGVAIIQACKKRNGGAKAAKAAVKAQIQHTQEVQAEAAASAAARAANDTKTSTQQAQDSNGSSFHE